jgi:hypothetical protein
MTRRVVLLLMVGLAAAPGLAGARQPRSIRLRMEGYVGPPPDGRNEQADLVLRAGKNDVRFQVTKGTLLSGRGFAADVWERVAPYKPSFTLRGPSELVDRVAKATPGKKLAITGVWVPPSRDFLVSGVEPGTPAP